MTLLAVRSGDASEFSVDLVVEMIEHDGGPLIGLNGFPWVDHQPSRGLFCSERAHVYSRRVRRQEHMSKGYVHMTTQSFPGQDGNSLSQ